MYNICLKHPIDLRTAIDNLFLLMFFIILCYLFFPLYEQLDCRNELGYIKYLHLNSNVEADWCELFA